MRLKLDLHPIFNDARRIEEALQEILDEALTRHATEVEIIPGKGSGALKKTVIRFLERPEIKTRYHRLEKDSDNWGRLFVHFRHDRSNLTAKPGPQPVKATVETPCACCNDPLTVFEPEDDLANDILTECPWCGSPNRVSFRRDRRGAVHARAALDYAGA